jgi:hypothetical protein
MPSVDRATRLGITIAIVAVLSLVLSCAGVYLLIRFAPSRPPTAYNPIMRVAATSQANAGVLVMRRFQKRFAASAVLDLPPVPPQKDSPSLQITFYQRDALIQGGIIRTPKNHFRMTPFLEGFSPSKPRGGVRYFGAVPDGPHVVALSGDTNAIDFTVDGKLVDRVPRADYLPIHGQYAPWLTLGTIVDTPGDAAYGTISKIDVRGEDDAGMIRVVPNCVVTRGGLEMRRVGDEWVLGGTYVPGVHAKYVRCTRQDMS